MVFKDEIENDDGPVVCADDEPPLKPEKQEKDRRFFPFFKKKKKVGLYVCDIEVFYFSSSVCY